MSSASAGIMENITTMMPNSTSRSPIRVITPWVSSSLISATSFMTRRDGYADDVGIVIAEGQFLQVAEKLAAQVGQNTLAYPREQVALPG